jgi:hypothetical protein
MMNAPTPTMAPTGDDALLLSALVSAAAAGSWLVVFWSAFVSAAAAAAPLVVESAVVTTRLTCSAVVVWVVWVVWVAAVGSVGKGGVEDADVDAAEDVRTPVAAWTATAGGGAAHSQTKLPANVGMELQTNGFLEALAHLMTVQWRHKKEGW